MKRARPSASDRVDLSDHRHCGLIAADWFGHTAVLSGEASPPASVTGPFDRESLNSAEQTFTVMGISFMVAHAESAKNGNETMPKPWKRSVGLQFLCDLPFFCG